MVQTAVWGVCTPIQLIASTVDDVGMDDEDTTYHSASETCAQAHKLQHTLNGGGPDVCGGMPRAKKKTPVSVEVAVPETVFERLHSFLLTPCRQRIKNSELLLDASMSPADLTVVGLQLQEHVRKMNIGGRDILAILFEAMHGEYFLSSDPDCSLARTLADDLDLEKRLELHYCVLIGGHLRWMHCIATWCEGLGCERRRLSICGD